MAGPMLCFWPGSPSKTGDVVYEQVQNDYEPFVGHWGSTSLNLEHPKLEHFRVSTKFGKNSII
jgi:hypothetical protein